MTIGPIEVSDDMLECVRDGYGDDYPELDGYTAELLAEVFAYHEAGTPGGVMYSTVRDSLGWSRDKTNNHLAKNSATRTGLEHTPYIEITKVTRPNGSEEREFVPTEEGCAALKIWRGQNHEEVQPASERPTKWTVEERREMETRLGTAHERIDDLADQVENNSKGVRAAWWRSNVAMLMLEAREEWSLADMYAQQAFEGKISREQAIGLLREELSYLDEEATPIGSET